MNMVYRSYKKSEIATRMLETALDLYFDDRDGFSMLHLAAAAEAVLAGLIKSNKNKINNSSIKTAREKTISVLEEIHSKHGTKRTEKEIGTYLNFVINKTKHHNAESDSFEISACLDLEVEGAILRAIENYWLLFGDPTEKMVQYINHISLRIGPVSR